MRIFFHCLSIVWLIKISVAFCEPVASWFAYVPDRFSNSVTPIELDTNQLDIPVVVGERPQFVVITPDAATAYVMNSGSPGFFQEPAVPGSVTPFDVATNIPLTEISFASLEIDFFPRGIAITPDGGTVYVSGNDIENVGILIPISTTTNLAGPPIFLNVFGSGRVAITPDGEKALVLHNNQVTVVTLSTQTVGPTINVPDLVSSIAITPDNAKAYIVSTNLWLYPIDIATLTLDEAVSIPCVGDEVAITPNGETIYITCPNGGNTLVLPVDIATNTPGAFINTSPAQPFGIAIAPDSLTAYVTTSSPSVIPIDLSTQMALTPIAFTNGTDSISITPDQAPFADFDFTVGGVNSETFFDASSSFSDVGTIVNYFWDFGDDQTELTESPTTSHIYTSPGTYEVVLTVTNSAGTSTTRTFTGTMVSNNGGPDAQTSQLVTISSLLPPSEIFGRRISRCDGSINIISWRPPSGTPPTEYRIYRNSISGLIGTVPGDVAHRFVDRHIWQSVTYTYYVVSVDDEGNESEPAMVTIYPSFINC